MGKLVNGIMFTEMVCGDCGIIHYMPESFRAECEKIGPTKLWYCPNGHGRHYRESTADVLRKELTRQTELVVERGRQLDTATIAIDRLKARLKRAKK